MLKKNLALVLVALLGAGCGIEARTYVITKPRVGLDNTSGNGGCVMGKCPPPPAPTETTRKIYVLELTRPVPESEVQKIEETAVNAITEGTPTDTDTSTPAAENAPAVDNSQPAAPVVPVVGEMPGTIASESTPAAATDNTAISAQGGGTYTVQKDDTLQKISKKVYGTYAKWYRIYKANKDKINNPNVLQPGVVLTIPSEK